MKYSINQIFAAYGAIQSISKTDFSGKLSYLLATLSEELIPILTRVESEKVKICKKYESEGNATSTELENGAVNYQIKPDFLEEFSKEMDELFEIEEEIKTIIPLNLFDSIQCTPEFMKNVKPFLVN